MRKVCMILGFWLLANAAWAQTEMKSLGFNFYGDSISIPVHASAQVPFVKPITTTALQAFYNKMAAGAFSAITDTLLAYRNKHELDDWLFYQLIRSTAEQLSPKAANYERYTLYKWYLLQQTGFAAMLTVSADKILLYIQSDEEIFEIPCRYVDGKQYVCLNYHDYSPVDFKKEIFEEVVMGKPGEGKAFTYKVTRLPQFKRESYAVKALQFDYGQKDYHFKVLVSKDVQKIFTNYPVVDYQYYFNIPLSHLTYTSLIPLLKEEVKKLHQQKGVDYLMRFTRYAFPFAADTRVHGREKRLSPEQTLLYEYSDCEDRAAFFFYLVKEIYNLPMIVLQYPDHITVAVQFDKPVGHPIAYKGQLFSVCEATPQRYDLPIGQAPQHLRKKPFEIVYEYQPAH